MKKNELFIKSKSITSLDTFLSVISGAGEHYNKRTAVHGVSGFQSLPLLYNLALKCLGTEPEPQWSPTELACTLLICLSTNLLRSSLKGLYGSLLEGPQSERTGRNRNSAPATAWPGTAELF